MNNQRAAYVVILIGVVTMLSALLADVSVSTGQGFRVANLDLMSQRQMKLIFGGIVFLAGVILLVAGRPGAKSDSSSAHDESPLARYAAQEAERSRQQQARRESAEATKREVLQWFVQASEPKGGRLATGLFVGFCLALLALAINPLLSVVCVVVSVAYSLRNAPSVQIQTHLHLLNLLVFGAFSALAAVAFFAVDKFAAPIEMSSTMAVVTFVFTGLPALVSVFAVVWLRLRRRGA